MRGLKRAGIVLMGGLAVAGCKPRVQAPITPHAAAAEATGAHGAEAQGVAVDRGGVDIDVEDLVSNFERVHFALDSATLDGGARSALTRNGAILRRRPDVSIEVQGHADERGTTDYNLALGQRRASAVIRYLTALGVSPRRISPISYGEEVPLESGAAETAWSANRRAEFRVTAGSGVEGTISSR
jgi:peptidoglycan-associated lipoprotein